MQAEVLRQAVDISEIEAAAGPIAGQDHHGRRALVPGRHGVHELLPACAHRYIPHLQRHPANCAEDWMRIAQPCYNSCAEVAPPACNCALTITEAA